MKKVVKENHFCFAEINNEVFEALDNMEFDKYIITDDEVKTVLGILGVDSGDQQYLSAVRNSVVRHYNEKSVVHYKEVLSAKENGTWHVHDKYLTNMSAITAALDSIAEFV